MILSLITYPLSPKIKPIHTVSANVSKLPPLLYLACKVIYIYDKYSNLLLILKKMKYFFFKFHDNHRLKDRFEYYYQYII